MKNKGKKTHSTFDKRDNQLFGVLFSLPFIIGFVFIFLFIFVNAIRFSFSDMTLGDNGFELNFVWFENFRYALRGDPVYVRILLDALKNMLTTIPVVLIFSLFVAVVLNKKLPGRTVFRAIFFLPVIVATGLVSKLDMSNVVMTVMNSGAIETGAETTGSALGDVSLMLQGLNFSPSLISFVSGMSAGVVNIVNLSGVQILIFLAGIQSISPSIYESASVEGVTAWEMFWKITLPMVSPMLLVNIFYTIIDYLTRDNNELMTYINTISFEKGYYGQGAAMAWLYFLVVAVILVIIILIVNRFVFTYQRER